MSATTSGSYQNGRPDSGASSPRPIRPGQATVNKWSFGTGIPDEEVPQEQQPTSSGTQNQMEPTAEPQQQPQSPAQEQQPKQAQQQAQQVEVEEPETQKVARPANVTTAEDHGINLQSRTEEQSVSGYEEEPETEDVTDSYFSNTLFENQTSSALPNATVLSSEEAPVYIERNINNPKDKRAVWSDVDENGFSRNKQIFSNAKNAMLSAQDQLNQMNYESGAAYRGVTKRSDGERSFIDDPAAARYSDQSKKEKERARLDIADKHFEGNAFLGTMRSDSSIKPIQVGVGEDIIEAVLSVPNNDFINFVNKNSGKNLSPESSVKEVVDAINSSNIWVVTAKSPVNRSSSTQRRVLFVVPGDGIALHPTQNKSYNADFDGDQMAVQTTWDNPFVVPSAMSFLIDIDGKCTIDPSFFPMPYLDENKDSHKLYVRMNVFSRWRKRVGFDRLYKSLFDLSHNPSDNAKWVEFVTAIHDLAEDDMEMSDILQAAFDGMRDLHSMQIIEAEQRPEFESDYIPPEYPADVEILDLLDKAQMGMPPLNFQDFKRIFSKFTGEIKDKNASFRIGAEVAKLIRWDSRIQVGENNLSELYEKTMAACSTKRQSGVTAFGEKQRYIAEELRTRIINKIGMPYQHQTVRDFMVRFALEYSQVASLVNAAEINVLANFSLRRPESFTAMEINPNSVGDVVKAFINVYGEYTLDTLFGNNFRFGKIKKESEDAIGTILERYRDTPLRSFSTNNTVYVKQSQAKRIKKNKMNEYKNDGDFFADVLLSAADRKTSQASRYNIEMNGFKTRDEYRPGIFDHMLTALRDLNKMVEKQETKDWRRWSDDLVNLLIGVSPDIFAFYGIGSTEAFLSSTLGKRLLKAKTADEVGGIYESMVVGYRLSRANQAIKDYKREIDFGHKDTSRLVHEICRFTMELDELASSSQAWFAIVSEMRGRKGTTNFSLIKQRAQAGQQRILITSGFPHYSGWAKLQHESLLDVMLDLNMSYADKNSILADVVRETYSTPHIYQFQMGYQLVLDPDATYSTLGFHADGGIFDTLKNASKGFKYYDKRSYQKARKEVEKAYKQYKGTGTLTQLISDLDNNPDLLVEVPKEIYTNALLAAMDKTYDDSEKSKQQAAITAIYQALIYAITGGGSFSSDVYKMDNLALGLRQKDQLSIRDLIHILNDGSASIYIYNEAGVVKRVDRATLLGVDETEVTEDVIWNWLRDHPRLAMCLRHHQTNVVADREAKAFISATNNLSDMLDGTQNRDESDRKREIFNGKAKLELWDRYGFGSLVMLLVPAEGSAAPTLRSIVAETQDKLYKVVCGLAALKQSGNEIASQAITEKAIQFEDGNFLTANYLKSIGMGEAEANHLISELNNNLYFYASRVAEIANEAGYIIPNRPNLTTFSKPDESSIANYYDVKQLLCGAKTQVSTSVEGTETHKLAFWSALYRSKDEYADMSRFEPSEILETLAGGVLTDGTVIDESTIDDIMDRLQKGEELIVKVPDGVNIAQEVLDDHGEPIASLNRWLMIKRDDGAEKLNLKIKKLGDDESDSITKLFDRRTKRNWLDYDSGKTYEYVTGQIQTIYAPEDSEVKHYDEAVRWLATYLYDLNFEMGYTDMNVDDYMNIAKELLLETENGIVLRSWEQVVYAIKHRLSADLIENGNQKDVYLAEREIASTVGATEFTGDPAMLFDGIRIAGTSGFSSVLRQQSSSTARNFDLMTKISKVTKMRAYTQAEMREKARVWISKETDKNVKKLAEIVNSVANYHVMGNLSNGALQDWQKGIGKQVAYVLTEGTPDLRPYYSRGNSIFVNDPSVFDGYDKDKRDFFKANLVQVDDHIWVLPFFDVKLNGVSTPGKLFGKSGSFQAFDDQVTVLVESTTGQYGVGDAMVQLFKSLVDRIKINWSDTLSLPASDLFANTFRRYKNNKENINFQVRFASDEEVQRFILNQNEEFALDYGVSTSNRDFHKIKRMIDNGIKEYVERSDMRNQNGWIENDNRPNQIVAWAMCDVYTGSGTKHVLAPIMPWKTGRTSLIHPQNYSIEALGYNKAKAAFEMDWKYTGDPTKAFFKMFDGSSASNKMIGSARDVKPSPMLKSGVPIDAAVYVESTASRRLGTNKRMSTLVTMFFMARRPPYGYNFADLKDSFPDNRDLAERLQQERIETEEWPSLLKDVKRFSSDPKIDAFVRKEVNMCIERGINPSDFFASQFGGRRSCMYYEFETLMETSYDYQDMLLHYFHKMMPTFCPDGLNGDWHHCLFRPCKQDDPQRKFFSDAFDIGCMQMQVPYTTSKGETKYVWENVFAGFSFFGEEYSGFHRPNINGASKMNDQLNALALHGRIPEGMDFRSVLKWAMSDIDYNSKHGILYADVQRLASTEEGE